MMIAANNNASEGMCYFAYEEARFCLCSFVGNSINRIYQHTHGVISLYYSDAKTVLCDFIDNVGPIIRLIYSNIVYESCLFEGNPAPTSFNVTNKNQVHSTNAVDNWVMTPEGCHIHKVYTMKCRQKLRATLMAFLINS